MGREEMQTPMDAGASVHTRDHRAGGWIQVAASTSSPQTPELFPKLQHALVSKTSAASSTTSQHFKVLLSLNYEMPISSFRFKNISCMEQNKFRKAVLPSRKAQPF